MSIEVEATYEDGALKLSRAVPLAQGQKVNVIIKPQGGAVSRLAGLIPWTGDPGELERFLNDPDEGILGQP